MYTFNFSHRQIYIEKDSKGVFIFEYKYKLFNRIKVLLYDSSAAKPEDWEALPSLLENAVVTLKKYNKIF